MNTADVRKALSLFLLLSVFFLEYLQPTYTSLRRGHTSINNTHIEQQVMNNVVWAWQLESGGVWRACRSISFSFFHFSPSLSLLSPPFSFPLIFFLLHLVVSLFVAYSNSPVQQEHVRSCFVHLNYQDLYPDTFVSFMFAVLSLLPLAGSLLFASVR